jgi:2-hydroxy-6-oxonona-2,4-dienedioate hydrolase
MKLPDNLIRCSIRVNDKRLHHVASADPHPGGRPIVLVHGVGLSHRYLVPLATLLADQLPLYLPDLPGFGRSYKPLRILNLNELADWLADWLRAVGLRDAGVMGQSLGCQVAIHLAARHPELVGRLVLQGVTVDPGARSLWQQFIRWRQNQQTEDKSAMPSAFPDYLACGLRRIIRTYKYAVDDRPEQLLPRIQCPTLVVRGEHDVIGSHAWHEQVTELLPRGRLETVSGVGHTINVSAPNDLAQLLRTFCA